ncbi:hypothetical protein ACH4Y0_02130 [Streptomyces sp. NPDC020707]|uniref:hypothetical protein n=1 Tax=Streptomyces sp. NPDC020707 TaxID=3365084 RepID=UPI0037BC877B
MSTTRRRLGIGPAATSTTPARPLPERLLPAERTADARGEAVGRQDAVPPRGRRNLSPGAEQQEEVPTRSGRE